MITTVVLLIHVFLALGLIGLILLQHGKGADAGAAFGSGASSTMFGAQGSASFMSRATKWLAILFFITSGSLAYLSQGVTESTSDSIMDAPVEQTAPAMDEEDADLPPVMKAVDDDAAQEESDDEPAVDAEDDPADDDTTGDGGQ